MIGDWGLVLHFLNNWHLSQLPNRVRSEKLGVRSEGTAHKNMEAPQNFDSASRHRHWKRSLQIFLAERSAFP